MAEEVQYSSGSDSATNKRKYEGQTTPPPSSGARRTTGFSAPITSQSPDSGHAPPSYNSVPPPVDEIQLAKQRAQEIAARLFNNVEAKRPRVENGGGGFDSIDNKGFSSGPTDMGQKPIISNAIPSSMGYGFQGTSKKIEIPNGRVGVIIGKSGETIKYLQLQSGAKIQVTRDMDADPNSTNRLVELMGTSEQIAKAEQLINDVLSEAESGGSGTVSRRVTGQQAGAEQFVMKIPNNKVGLVIGKGGETIKNMQARTGARIQVIPLHLPPGDTSTERTVQIDGTSEQIESAKQLVNEVTSENRVRNPTMTGGYTQQGYQAPRPPTSWAPPGGAPMQLPGYSYVQPGTYPGTNPQYGMSQPPYGGYPPQPTSGGYTSGWDNTTPQANPQSAQGGAYDYYSQQAQQAAGGAPPPADSSGYSYNQPPASAFNQAQGYSQDGYGGYHAPAPQSGYDQQQQGYNTATGYGGGSVTNPTSEGHAPSSYGAQGDSNQAAAAAQPVGQQGYNGTGQQQPSYGAQPPSGYGTGYGPPQAQKPPANQGYGQQTQQSPSAQGGGYAQAPPPVQQPGYPPAQSGYAQPDSSAAQRAPPNPGYGTAAAQSGYAPPPYGAQPGYGQQAQAYNTAYGGGGYSQQPPVYSAEGGNAGAAAAVPKASPQG